MTPRQTLLSTWVALACAACAASSDTPPAAADFSATRERAERARGGAQTTQGRQAPARDSAETPRAGGAPARVDTGSLARRYPPDTYLLGLGESPDGALAAEYAARAQVARQIQAVLETSIQIETRGTLADAQTTVEEAVRETSRFDRGELMTLVREHSSCERGVCSAVVVLHRPSATATLLDEIGPALDEYGRTIERALASRDPWSFTPLWRSVATQSAALHARLQIIQSVAGRPPDALVALRQQERALADHRTLLLRQHVLALGDLRVDDPALRDLLDDSLRRTLGEAGASLGSATACSPGARVDVNATIQCQQAFVGIRCSLEGTLSSRDCQSGRELGSTRLSGCAVGAHPSEEGRARSALAQSMREPRFATCLRDALSSWWPLH